MVRKFDHWDIFSLYIEILCGDKDCSTISMLNLASGINLLRFRIDQLVAKKLGKWSHKIV